MLGTLPEGKKAAWHDLVPTILPAYNCTKCNSSGFSPYYLMSVYKCCLSIDLYFGTQTPGVNAKTSTEYIQQLSERLCWPYKMAYHVVNNHKCNYDQKVK